MAEKTCAGGERLKQPTGARARRAESCNGFRRRSCPPRRRGSAMCGSTRTEPDRRVAEGSPGRVPDVQYTRRSASPPSRTHRPPHRQCHRRLVLRTPAIGVRDHKTLRLHLDRTGHRTGRRSSPAGQGAQDLVYVLDGQREVSLGGQEPYARAWQRRRLMAAVLRRDHEVVLAVP